MPARRNTPAAKLSQRLRHVPGEPVDAAAEDARTRVVAPPAKPAAADTASARDVGLVALVVLAVLGASLLDSARRDALTLLFRAPRVASSPRAHAWSKPHIWNWDDADVGRGPSAWGAIANATTGASAYPLCSSGRAQSPVNIVTTAAVARGGRHPLNVRTKTAAVRLTGDYAAGFSNIVFAPHSRADAAEWNVDGTLYTLVQFHFHAPSEHTVDSEAFPFETHFVFTDGAGGLAVLGLLHRLAADGAGAARGAPGVERLWQTFLAVRHALGIADDAAERDLLPDALDVQALLDAARVTRYFRYDGSLTTPPCTEGIKWHVAISAVDVSAEQRASFSDAIHAAGNARGLHTLGDRVVHTLNA
jgi:carbonic anhydrase